MMFSASAIYGHADNACDHHNITISYPIGINIVQIPDDVVVVVEELTPCLQAWALRLGIKTVSALLLVPTNSIRSANASIIGLNTMSPSALGLNRDSVSRGPLTGSHCELVVDAFTDILTAPTLDSNLSKPLNFSMTEVSSNRKIACGRSLMGISTSPVSELAASLDT